MQARWERWRGLHWDSQWAAFGSGGLGHSWFRVPEPLKCTLTLPQTQGWFWIMRMSSKAFSLLRKILQASLCILDQAIHFVYPSPMWVQGWLYLHSHFAQAVCEWFKKYNNQFAFYSPADKLSKFTKLPLCKLAAWLTAKTNVQKTVLPPANTLMTSSRVVLQLFFAW